MRSLATSWSLLPVSLLASITQAAHFEVAVGKGGQLRFDPETLDATVGDTVTYRFFAKKHSVVQSSFTQPCQPLTGGFFSGFTPSNSSDTPAPTTWTITINDTKPIWAYCSQTVGNHCQSGMVHAINAPKSGNTIDAYRELAAQTPNSTSPADLLPVGGVRKLHVDVGLDGLTFTPSNITELPRTVVEFSFNPKNHSVVQSNFANPCQPLEGGGFSSGFIPTAVSPSGALFDIVIPDTKPIWFYCAQTAGTHCQKGMVGSINAPTNGTNTFEAFVALAAKAPPSTIPPKAPLVGTVTVNGTIINSFNGAVLNADAPINSTVPPPGTDVPPAWSGMAGGGQPSQYNWAPDISPAAVSFLQLLQFLDDILLEVLFQGYNKLHAGAWAAAYPKSIVDTIGSMSAQALVHRATVTDCLAHYKKPLQGTCSYVLQTDNVDAFLQASLTLLLLEIGVLTDVSAGIAAADPWLVPVLITEVGAKSRMTAVVNMMQNHLAAAAPREVMIPAPLAWSYATRHFIQSCPDTIQGMPERTWPALTVTGKQEAPGGGRTTALTLKWDTMASSPGADSFVAWIGPWGDLEFTPLGADGTATVPGSLYGHVWIVVVSKSGVKLQDLPSVTIAGPEMVWVSQP